MTLGRNAFVTQVEIVVGGSLPRNGFVQPVELVGGGLGGTLDDAYDSGGAGAGRTITVDAGPVALVGAGSPATIGLLSMSGSQTVPSAAGATWNAVLVDTDVTLSGATNVTTATGFNMVTLNAPTITDGGTITSVTNAATLYVGGAPSGSGLSVTNAYSLWVDDGRVRFDERLEIGAIGSASAPSVYYAGSTAAGLFFAAVNSVGISATGSTYLNINGNSNAIQYSFVLDAATSGATTHFLFTAGADTAQTAATEVIDVDWNLSATMQHNGGSTVATQRSFLIRARTYSSVSAGGVITTAATCAITGAPVAGTNTTITNSLSLWVDTGSSLFGDPGGGVPSPAPVGIGNIPTATETFVVNAKTTLTQAAGSVWNGVHFSNGSFGSRVNFLGATNITTATGFNYLSVDQPALIATAGPFTITNAATVYIANAPTGAGGPFITTITNPYALWVDSGNSRFDGVILASDGSFTAPSIAATSQTGSGIYFTSNLFITGQNTAITVGGTSTAVIAAEGVTITQQAVPGFAAGNPQALTVTAGAWTNAIALDFADVFFNLTRNAQRAAGNITSVRAVLITPPTYTAVGASTYTNAVTLAVSGPPTAGANVTITNPYSFWIQSGRSRFDGPLEVTTSAAGLSNIAFKFFNNSTTNTIATQVIGAAWSSGTNQILSISGAGSTGGTERGLSVLNGGITAGTATGIRIAMSASSGGTQKYLEIISATGTSITASAEVNFVDVDLTGTDQWATGAITDERLFRVRANTIGFVGASTVTRATTFAIDGSPTAGTNATLTTALAFWVAAGGTGSFNTYFGATPSLGGGIGVIGIANAGTNPGSNPTAGGILYANAGAGTWRGSGGTVTAFGPAGPHCADCGKDEWTVATLNVVWKSWRFVCGSCGAVYAGGPRDVRSKLPEEHRRKIIRKDMGFAEIEKLVA